MALLTADDVLNKKFTPTKFREGYDLDDVDDFLDDVVDTIGSLQEENERLKAQLEGAERRIAELVQAQAETPAAPVAPVVPEAAPVAEAPEAPVEAPVEAPAATEPESATSMLALAQRLHDEYVRDGREEGERIVSEARTESERIAREAKEEQDRALGQFEQERTLLEKKIEELKAFERDYREQIGSHLETLLGNVRAGGEN